MLNRRTGRSWMVVVFVGSIHEHAATSQLPAVQSLSHVQLLATPWAIACQASLSLSISGSLPKFISIESVMPTIQSSHPLFSPIPFAFNVSQHKGLFQLFTSGGQSIGALALASVLLSWLVKPLLVILLLASESISNLYNHIHILRAQSNAWTLYT